MARVDKKPTYGRAANVAVAVWCDMAQDPDLIEMWCGVDYQDVIMARREATRHIYANVDADDMSPGYDRVAYLVEDVGTRRRKTSRQAMAREAVRAWLVDKPTVYDGGNASVLLLNAMLDPAYHLLDMPKFDSACSATAAIFEATASDAMLPEGYGTAVVNAVRKNPMVAARVLAAESSRKVLSSAVSREEFVAWMCIGVENKFHTTAQAVEETKAEDRFSISSTRFARFGFKAHYTAGVLILRRDGEILLLDKDARERVRVGMQSVASAVLWAEICAQAGVSDTRPAQVAAGATRLIQASAEVVAGGGHHSDVVKATSVLHMSLFQGMEERDQAFSPVAVRKAAALAAEAREKWPGIDAWASSLGVMPTYALMELTKLGNVLPPADGDAAASVGRLKAAQLGVRRVNPTTWNNFMNYCKASDLARAITRKKGPVAYGGVEPSGAWYDKCIGGVYTLPPDDDWGKTWVEGEFPVADTCDFEWLTAQDVTWVGSRDDAVPGKLPPVSNEVVEAWVHGPRIDRHRTGVVAALHAFEVGSDALWANKSENNKVPAKQRLTASTDAGSRAGLSSFETAVRRTASMTPGFAQGLDPFSLNEKLKTVMATARKNPRSFVSSHDVKGWSEFEDRNAKDEYVRYRAQMHVDATGVVLAAPSFWGKVRSHFVKMGEDYHDNFAEGGIQGLQGALDSELHAKIIGFIQATGVRKGILTGNANTLTCIDDVVYNPSVRESAVEKAVADLEDLMYGVYDDLAYPLDPMKSIVGVLKMVFLSDYYADEALIGSPMRIALKADVDTRPAIRTARGNWASFMSTAGAVAEGNGMGAAAYLFGTLLATCNLMHDHPAVADWPAAATAAVVLMPAEEGGFGHLPFRCFLHGADADMGATWRVIGAQCGNEAVAGAIASLSGHGLMQVDAAATIRNPFQIRHDICQPGDIVRKRCIEEAMWAVPHAKEWDDMRSAASAHITALAQGMVTAGGIVDAVGTADLADTYPDALIDELVGKFSMTGAAPKLISRRVVWRIARSVARADRKWIADVGRIAMQPGFPRIANGLDETAALRAFTHAELSVANAVVPSARSAVAYGGVFDSALAPDFDWVRVNAKEIRAPGGRVRQDQCQAMTGRIIGIKSANAGYTELAHAMRADPIGKRIVKFAAIMRTYIAAGVDVADHCTLFEKAWGLDFSVADLNVNIGSVSMKRVASVTAHRDHMALAYRHIYGAASAKVDGLFAFVRRHVGHSLIDPLEVAHMAKLCACNASAIAGAANGGFANISWRINPAAMTQWAYELPPGTMGIDLGDDGAAAGDCEQTFATPYRRVTAESVMAAVAADVMPFQAPARDPKVDIGSVALFAAKAIGSVVGEAAQSETHKLRALKRAVPVRIHARNLVATSIVKVRVGEAVAAAKIRVADVVWPDDNTAVDTTAVAKQALWDRIYDDATIMMPGHESAIGAALAHIGGPGTARNMDRTSARAWAGSDSGVRRKLITAAYDGIVGSSSRSYSGEARHVRVVSDAAAANASARASILNRRRIFLATRYSSKIASSVSNEDSSFWQGRALVRKTSIHRPGPDGSGSVVFSARAIAAAMRSSNGVCPDPVPGDDLATAEDLIRMNYETHGRTKNSRWVPDAFERGARFEMVYVIRDIAEQDGHTYAVTKDEISHASDAVNIRWSMAAMPAEIPVPGSVPDAGGFAAAVAAAAKAVSAGAIAYDDSASSSSEDDAEGNIS